MGLSADLTWGQELRAQASGGYPGPTLSASPLSLYLDDALVVGGPAHGAQALTHLDPLHG